jgi:hypothetical protein
MQKRILAAVLTAAVGCSPPPMRCGDEICKMEERCTTEKKCVLDTKPTLTLDAPMDMVQLTTNNVEVRGTAKDDDTPPTLELSTNMTTWTPVKLNADGTFIYQMPLPKIDSSTVVLSARVRDSRQQETKVARTLRVDNTPPECSLTTPTDAGFTNSTGNLPLTLRATDGSMTLLNPRVSTDLAGTFNTPPTAGRCRPRTGARTTWSSASTTRRETSAKRRSRSWSTT